MTNAFKPLAASEKAQGNKKQNRNNEGEAILPVPQDVQLDIPPHNLGTPSIVWDYRDAEGNLLYRVARFITKDGEKEDRPLTYRKYSNGDTRWTWKSVEAPRPLYGLDRLAEKPDALVIVCEGEKATDAATEIFSEHVAVTSPNGAGPPHKADWTPLEGCDVTIWPDNDDEGIKYAKQVARLLKSSDAVSISIVQVPNIFPAKWDLADGLPDGISKNNIQELLNHAEPVIDPLENLVDRVKEDIGEAYKPEVLEELSLLQRENMPAFMSLRD